MDILVIVGPTACGKTQTAINLAKKIDAEIISADSMQIYKSMNIGTAKPTIAEQDGIPHHLLDIIEPCEHFSVAKFAQLAIRTIEEITNRGKTPILVGGTGFYINSVLYENMATEDDEIEQKILTIGKNLQKSLDIYQKLQQVDPISANKIHPNNTKRVIRALAYQIATGRKFSDNIVIPKLRYNALSIMLDRNRASLYDSIDERVEKMFSQGLVEEVKNLISMGIDETATAMQAIGYKEILPYIRGLCSLEEAKSAVKQHSRRYAKRQWTWFRHQMRDVIEIQTDDKTPEELAIIIEDLIACENGRGQYCK
ncbi:MAG: tRNA (adenosine(37)-N6)-dimethylallyltransferase MiaA [Turicibacter sp.]|nr:tRNA (adenosine(37)-N6)-dimethylallyltransferase MiaA [Turicibacter sp.]